MSSISIIKLYDLLTAKVGRETAENLTSFIEEKVKEEMDNKSEILATKKDIAEIKAEIKKDIADVRENAALNKADTIKWMFIFWIGQIGATFGFILLFLKK